ncbi:hypothetical protein N431DRAFT_461067 [Stipitochalara longipes BDJ]|nr:hypothetical protein N431DRAFT_461067 [Stipitochalara longipes BDJ]
MQDFSYDEDSTNEMGNLLTFGPPFGGAEVGILHGPLHSQYGAFQPAAEQVQSQIIGAFNQSNALNSSGPASNGLFSPNDGSIWSPEEPFGYMSPSVENATHAGTSNMTTLPQRLDGSYFDALGRLQSGLAMNGDMLDPLQDFDNFALPFGQTAPVAQMSMASVQQHSAAGAIFCTQFPCPVTFKRDADRIRHEAAVHGINRSVYLCHVVGCNKSQGVGYTRKDKLTEHLWRKHANLGFVKRT